MIQAIQHPYGIDGYILGVATQFDTRMAHLEYNVRVDTMQKMCT